jgi:hypothetical protein
MSMLGVDPEGVSQNALCTITFLEWQKAFELSEEKLYKLYFLCFPKYVTLGSDL